MVQILLAACQNVIRKFSEKIIEFSFSGEQRCFPIPYDVSEIVHSEL